MSAVTLEINDHGYVWDGKMVTFETCPLDPYKDKLFLVTGEGNVFEVEKALDITKVKMFRSMLGSHVLSRVEISDNPLPYETVFHNLPREGKFCQGSSPVFPGYTFGKNWNGFASPYFTADTFMEICQYFSLVYGNESGEDLAVCRCYYLPEDDAFYVED